MGVVGHSRGIVAQPGGLTLGFALHLVFRYVLLVCPEASGGQICSKFVTTMEVIDASTS